MILTLKASYVIRCCVLDSPAVCPSRAGILALFPGRSDAIEIFLHDQSR